MKKLALATLVLSTAVLSQAQALPLPFKVSVFAGGIEQNPSGVVSYKAQGSQDYLDLKNDAHFSQKTQPIIGAKITNTIPFIPDIKLDYMPMKFSGYGTLNRQITFGGTTYQANANFNLNAKMDRFDILAYYHVPFITPATKNVVKVKAGLNVRVIDFDESFTGTDLLTGQTVTESKSLTVPVPMAHVGFSISPIKQASLVGDLNYISYESNNYYDYNIGVRFSPNGMFKHLIATPFIQVGYRYEKLKIDKDSVYADVKVDGPYAMVGLEF
ncbi:MAG: TIGR04219 family outer membrane beta-barrel protein [Candidatus Nanopusillus acidilobi]